MSIRTATRVGPFHGVFIWLSASTCFQPDTLLKLSPPCQPDGPGAGTLPTIPSIQRLRAPPPMARRPVGTLREQRQRIFADLRKRLRRDRRRLAARRREKRLAAARDEIQRTGGVAIRQRLREPARPEAHRELRLVRLAALLKANSPETCLRIKLAALHQADDVRVALARKPRRPAAMLPPVASSDRDVQGPVPVPDENARLRVRERDSLLRLRSRKVQPNRTRLKRRRGEKN